MIEIDDEVIYPTFTPKCKYEPLVHQLEALKFMREREKDITINGGFLCLNTGLGKTFTTLYHLTNQGGQTLILCPKSLISTWADEIKKFYGNTLSYFVFRKDNKRVATITKEQLSRYNVVITNYEYVRHLCSQRKVYERVAMRDFNGNIFGCNVPANPPLREITGEGLLYSINWDRIVCDESHNFSNYKTSLWQSVMSLPGNSRWCLSGTIIRNYSEDLYSQYKFIGYYEPEFNIKGFSDLNLSKYIHYSNYVKAGIKLPESTRIDVPCNIDGEQEEIYNVFLKKTTKAFRDFTNKSASFASVFTLFLRLRQMLVAPHAIVPSKNNLTTKKKLDEYDTAMELVHSLPEDLQEWITDRNSSAGLHSSKINKAVEIVKSIRKGEKTIIFTIFRSTMELMKERLVAEGKKVLTVDGTVTGNSRDNNLNSFKNEDFDVLLISYKIGSEGLNLTEATNVILLDVWWSNATTEQAIARIHRMGQTKPVKIYSLYVPNTENIKSIESAMLEICQRKQKIANEYMTTGKCDNGTKMDAKTLGEILKVAYNKDRD